MLYSQLNLLSKVSDTLQFLRYRIFISGLESIFDFASLVSEIEVLLLVPVEIAMSYQKFIVYCLVCDSSTRPLINLSYVLNIAVKVAQVVIATQFLHGLKIRSLLTCRPEFYYPIDNV